MLFNLRYGHRGLPSVYWQAPKSLISRVRTCCIVYGPHKHTTHLAHTNINNNLSKHVLMLLQVFASSSLRDKATDKHIQLPPQYRLCTHYFFYSPAFFILCLHDMIIQAPQASWCAEWNLMCYHLGPVLPSTRSCIHLLYSPLLFTTSRGCSFCWSGWEKQADLTSSLAHIHIWLMLILQYPLSSPPFVSSEEKQQGSRWRWCIL